MYTIRDLFCTYVCSGMENVTDLSLTLPVGTNMTTLVSPEVRTSEILFLLRLYENCEYQRKHFDHDMFNDSMLFCPTMFDGWSCWNATHAGETAKTPCPNFIVGFDSRRFALRSCLENGTWFQHPITRKFWSNYTTCIDIEDLKFRKAMNIIYISGYSISLATLLISLVIFIIFKSLRCTRIAIHVHLFMSFACNNFMWIVWYRNVVGDPKIVEENPPHCQLLHILLQYFMLANYFWMFCEGLHLHLALVVVFVKDTSLMWWFHFIGWVVPLGITSVYAYVRHTSLEDTKYCWMNDAHSRWILTVPVCLSILVNLAILMNVLRVLLTKLHSNSTNPAPIGIRKAARAALILVPLFGLHHILLPFRPEPKSPWEMVYDVFSAVLVSSQGLCVSILFCFANVDVHGAFRKMFSRVQRRGTNSTMVLHPNYYSPHSRDFQL